MITHRQINIITNMANQESDGGARSAMIGLAQKLFPEDAEQIQAAYYNHPINVRWDEWVKAGANRAEFLLPED